MNSSIRAGLQEKLFSRSSVAENLTKAFNIAEQTNFPRKSNKTTIGGIRLKEILNKLLQTEQEAEKIVSDAEKKAQKILNERKVEADTLMLKATQEISKKREEALKDEENKLNSEIAKIKSEGESKIASLKNAASKSENEAVKAVLESLKS